MSLLVILTLPAVFLPTIASFPLARPIHKLLQRGAERTYLLLMRNPALRPQSKLREGANSLIATPKSLRTSYGLIIQSATSIRERSNLPRTPSQFLRVPDGKGSWDGFVSNPSSDGHHSNTSVLDFLHAKTFELLALNSTFLLGETKRIISIVSGNGASLSPLSVVGNAFEPSSDDEDLEPSSIGNHLDGLQRSSGGNIGESNSSGGGKQPSIARFGIEAVRSRWS
mmetsp:Transcript_16711/g.48517  ORF Transcript_16711/g.48517 Transcript_16711/m.48517 type:complete len:226 (-) Transcript_16711:322-999(-)